MSPFRRSFIMPNQDSGSYCMNSAYVTMIGNPGHRNFYIGSWYVLRLYFIRLLTISKLFILSLVGIATALGQPLDIPIILRTLAGTIALVVENSLPFAFDSDFLATLDTPAHDNCEVVDNYALRWWSGRKPRDLNTVDILNANTLEGCLGHYKALRSNAV